MIRSEVVDNDSGKPELSEVRTSSGVFLDRSQDQVVRRVEQRLAHYSQLPLEHGEPLHVLHYQEGEKYDPHYDYFHDNVNTQNGGQRVATVLLYLTDVEHGGETVFPDSSDKPHATDESYSECGRQGVAVKPRKGDALLFYSLTPGGDLDRSSLHAGCPVLRGDKWSATKWIRVGTHEVWSGPEANTRQAAPGEGEGDDAADGGAEGEAGGEGEGGEAQAPEQAANDDGDDGSDAVARKLGMLSRRLSSVR